MLTLWVVVPHLVDVTIGGLVVEEGALEGCVPHTAGVGPLQEGSDGRI